MSKFKEFIFSPHIHLALTTGFSIIIMAYFSKRICSEPIGYLALAFPPFIATIYESLHSKYKDKRICTQWYWIVAILVSTTFLIVIHL